MCAALSLIIIWGLGNDIHSLVFTVEGFHILLEFIMKKIIIWKNEAGCQSEDRVTQLAIFSNLV